LPPTANASREARDLNRVAWVASVLPRDQHRGFTPAAFLLEADDLDDHLLAPTFSHRGRTLARRSVGCHLGQRRKNLGDRLVASEHRFRRGTHGAPDY
jgi:hypothetical protein